MQWQEYLPLYQHVCINSTVIKVPIAKSPLLCHYVKGVIWQACACLACDKLMHVYYLHGWHMLTWSTQWTLVLCHSMMLGCAASATEIFQDLDLKWGAIKSGIALFCCLHCEPLSRVSVAKLWKRSIIVYISIFVYTLHVQLHTCQCATCKAGVLYWQKHFWMPQGVLDLH